MTLRVVVLGTGYWGKNLLRNLHAVGNLYGFYDVDPVVSAQHVEQYPGVVSYSSLEEALHASEVDAVAIATPAVTHGEITMAALEAGKHVFVEKPLCLDIDEANVLARLADANEKTLMVGHLLLYHPAFIALKQSVSSGAIGRLRYIHSTRASLGKIRRNENALWSFAPHDISMMLSLTGCLPNRVNCNGAAWLSPQVADMTLSHFDFGNQLQGHVFVSWLHPYKDHRLMVIGESGMLVFNDAMPGEDKLVLYSHSAGWDGELPVLEKAHAVPVHYEATEPLLQEMQHFVDCCSNGTRPRSDSTEATNVLALLAMCQRSLDSGRSVTLDYIKCVL